MNTLKRVGSTILVGLLFLGTVYVGVKASHSIKNSQELPLNDAAHVVYVKRQGGHGSGFYIGANRFLTAAHVVDGVETVDLLTTQPDGKMSEPKTAKVAWVDKERDVAMIVAEGEIKLPAAKLKCTAAKLKTLVQSVGYPMSLGLVWTWGRVSSPVTVLEGNSSQVIDLTIAPGNSGGPVFDEDHNVIGISRAVPSIGNMFSQSIIALGIITPAPTVCDAMNADHTKKPDVQTP